MKLNNFYLFLIIIFLFISCSKKAIKESVIIEKDLESQVVEAYKEGIKSLEEGDALFAAKNLMKQRSYFHNLHGLQSLH